MSFNNMLFHSYLGTCDEDDSSGGADDAAELGIGNIFTHTLTHSHIYEFYVLVNDKNQQMLVAYFLCSLSDVLSHL